MDFTVCEILFGICIDYNENFNIANFQILLGKEFINKSRTNKEPLYFIKFVSLLKNKIENIIYTKDINCQDIKSWERILAEALYIYICRHKNMNPILVCVCLVVYITKFNMKQGKTQITEVIKKIQTF